MGFATVIGKDISTPSFTAAEWKQIRTLINMFKQMGWINIRMFGDAASYMAYISKFTKGMLFTYNIPKRLLKKGATYCLVYLYKDADGKYVKSVLPDLDNADDTITVRLQNLGNYLLARY